MNLELALNTVPSDMRETARHKLLVLSDALLAVEEKWGELGTESRVIWIAAQVGDCNTPKGVRSLLIGVQSIVSFVDNWSDCARSGTPREDDDWMAITVAQAAGAEALGALHAIVDEARDLMRPQWKGQATPVSSPVSAWGSSTDFTRPVKLPVLSREYSRADLFAMSDAEVRTAYAREGLSAADDTAEMRTALLQEPGAIYDQNSGTFR